MTCSTPLWEKSLYSQFINLNLQVGHHTSKDVSTIGAQFRTRRVFSKQARSAPCQTVSFQYYGTVMCSYTVQKVRGGNLSSSFLPPSAFGKLVIIPVTHVLWQKLTWLQLSLQLCPCELRKLPPFQYLNRLLTRGRRAVSSHLPPTCDQDAKVSTSHFALPRHLYWCLLLSLVSLEHDAGSVIA